MNRLTAIGLASLVAYGLLITSKYTGVVSAARDDKSPHPVMADRSIVVGTPMFRVNPEPAQRPVSLPPPLPRAEQMRTSPSAVDFRSARDLKAFADALNARRASLTSDERYHLAKALEECQFTTTVNEDLAAYSAKQRRQFLLGLPGNNDALNAKRIAAYDAVDNTQRCMHFQGVKIAQKDIEELYHGAAMQGDARAQARLLVAELNSKASAAHRAQEASARVGIDDFSRIINLLETGDPEAVLMVGGFLAQQAMASQLRIGPHAEIPEPSALLGGFTLAACALQDDCLQLSREPQLACAYGGYCDARSYEELYQNFMVSPWSYSQAARYSDIIRTAIRTRNWALIGLNPGFNDKRTQR